MRYQTGETVGLEKKLDLYELYVNSQMEGLGWGTDGSTGLEKRRKV